MKEKTKQLKAEISKGLAAIAEIGDLVDKKTIRKKITALADDLRKLLKKDAKKKEKETAKAKKKAGKTEKKAKVTKPKKEEESPIQAKPQTAKAGAPKGRPAKKDAPSKGAAPVIKPQKTAESAKSLKAEVWKTSQEASPDAALKTSPAE